MDFRIMHRRARILSKVICFKISIRSIALEKFSNEHSKCSNQAAQVRFEGPAKVPGWKGQRC
jgi:hypothetical protein